MTWKSIELVETAMIIVNYLTQEMDFHGTHKMHVKASLLLGNCY
jgi:hypothetical protein